MKKVAAAFVLVIAAFVLGACAHGHKGHRAMEGKSQGSSAIYWCGSAADGACSGISIRPGTCPDGKPMNAGHVVLMEGNTALVCTCGADCTCQIDPKDHTKCGCNKPIRRIELGGTGLYFCNCGGSCACNMITDQPGNCKCGMPLKQVK